MENKPVMMYIHGFRSGANGSKREELHRHFSDRVRVIAPEVDADPPYFCERLDGVQKYTLTQDVLDKYRGYSFMDALTEKKHRLQALCSTNDELIGDVHIKALSAILEPDRLTIVNDFGHRCSGAGMNHLFTILRKITTLS